MHSNILTFLLKHEAFLHSISPLWVDGGAYKGEFIDACLNVRNDVQLVTFEPQPHRAHKLSKKYHLQANVEVFAKALGDRNVMTTLYITNANTLSSVYIPKPIQSSNEHRKYTVTETVQVEQVCLQNILDSPPGLVKLDIQGAELSAIRGLGDLLPKTAAFLVERTTRQRYQGQPSDAEFHFFLEEAGFVLKDTLPHSQSEGIEMYDALYIRDVTL